MASNEEELRKLVEIINGMLAGPVVHSIQFVSASYPNFGSPVWNTLSLEIRKYQAAVGTFLGLMGDTDKYSRSLLNAEYEEAPFWYRDWAPEKASGMQIDKFKVNGKLNYQFQMEDAYDKYERENDTTLNELLDNWETCLTMEFKTGATMWISQSHISGDDQKRLQVSSIFLMFSHHIQDEADQFRVAKLCRDYIIDYVIQLYQRRLRDELQLIDSRIWQSIKNLTKTIFTREHVINLIGRLRHAIYSKSPLLVVGEMGTGKVTVARQLFELSKEDPHNRLAVPTNGIHHHLIEINLGLTSDSVDTFLTTLKVDIEARITSTPEHVHDEHRVTVIFDDIHLASIKHQRAIKELLDFSVGFGPAPIEGMPPIHRGIFVTVKGRLGDLPMNSFLEELWFRISLFQIPIQALRHLSASELHPVIDLMLKEIGKSYDLKQVRNLTDDAIKYLETFEFQGNYRELFNMLLKAQFSTPPDHDLIDRYHLTMELLP